MIKVTLIRPNTMCSNHSMSSLQSKLRQKRSNNKGTCVVCKNMLCCMCTSSSMCFSRQSRGRGKLGGRGGGGGRGGCHGDRRWGGAEGGRWRGEHQSKWYVVCHTHSCISADSVKNMEMHRFHYCGYFSVNRSKYCGHHHCCDITSRCHGVQWQQWRQCVCY